MEWESLPLQGNNQLKGEQGSGTEAGAGTRQLLSSGKTALLQNENNSLFFLHYIFLPVFDPISPTWIIINRIWSDEGMEKEKKKEGRRKREERLKRGEEEGKRDKDEREVWHSTSRKVEVGENESSISSVTSQGLIGTLFN